MIIFLKCHNIQRGFLVYVKFLIPNRVIFCGERLGKPGGGYFTYHVNLIFLDTFRINSKY